jgi:lipoprotein-anchoring transpeptidase ErfK/SrfK
MGFLQELHFLQTRSGAVVIEFSPSRLRLSSQVTFGSPEFSSPEAPRLDLAKGQVSRLWSVPVLFSCRSRFTGIICNVFGVSFQKLSPRLYLAPVGGRDIMKTLFTSILTALILLASTQPAIAQGYEFDPSQDTLQDILSPDEVAEELGLSLEPQPRLFNASLSDRLLLLVDKSPTGTSPTAQTLIVYLDGRYFAHFTVSTGRERPELAASGRKYFSRTPIGDFRIQKMVKNYWSNTWKSPMPFSIFFIGGIAFHATTPKYYDQLGSRASGGCVRMTLEDSETLWNLVNQVGTKNVLIRVINPSGL